MPTFNFSIKSHSSKRYKTPRKINNYETIERNAKGIIHIYLSGEYYVKYNNEEYKLHKESYSGKGRKFFYHRHLIDGRITCNYRNITEVNKEIPSCYIPFCPGCVVTGSIVKEYGQELFKIRTIHNDIITDEVHNAKRFYLDNYEQIQCNLNQQ